MAGRASVVGPSMRAQWRRFRCSHSSSWLPGLTVHRPAWRSEGACADAAGAIARGRSAPGMAAGARRANGNLAGMVIRCSSAHA
jgi:hypothetical protein